VLKAVVPSDSGSGSHTAEHEYNGLGLAVLEKHTQNGEAKLTSAYVYYADGSQKVKTTTEGKKVTVTTYLYDNTGRLANGHVKRTNRRRQFSPSQLSPQP